MLIVKKKMYAQIKTIDAARHGGAFHTGREAGPDDDVVYVCVCLAWQLR